MYESGNKVFGKINESESLKFRCGISKQQLSRGKASNCYTASFYHFSLSGISLFLDLKVVRKHTLRFSQS